MAAADYITEVLSDSPRAFYELQDASGNPVDSSGNGFDIVTTGGTPAYLESDAPMSGSVSIRLFAGAYFSRPSFSTSVDNMAVEFWVQPIDILGDQRSVWNNYGSDVDRTFAINGWGLLINTNSHFQSIRQGIGVNAESAATISTPAIGDAFLPILGAGGSRPSKAGWSQIVITRVAGTWVYYLNGSLDTANAGTLAPLPPAGGIFGIVPYMAIMDISQPNRTWDFRVAFVSYYETSLSATQVSDHFAAAIL